MNSLSRWLLLLVALGMLAVARADQPDAIEIPRVLDERLEIRLFADRSLIVHPVGVAFDGQGRLLVIESHTHFPPGGYQGPKHDRLVILRDTDGDGRADQRQIFFEGTRHSMDIAIHPDGSVYLATRNQVLRLTDTDQDGKADTSEQILFLETTGAYPHNGLSGLHFDFRGDLFFGMGENLGASYVLRGSDGRTIADEGEGGNVFWCKADGSQLRRVATGFWNPFGICRDDYGRLFAVDNDPTANGCRLLHVVEGGNYGYHYRYGRSGLHPFLAWRGELPGTLPMASYVGEAPCELICYQAQGLPAEYRGSLLTACWGEHRLERCLTRARESSFSAQRMSVVQGGTDFRPVGIAVAPDGSLMISDWVKRDYELHGFGRIWQLRSKDSRPAAPISPDPFDTPVRADQERAARRLLAQGTTAVLEQQLKQSTSPARSTALEALLTLPRVPDVVIDTACKDADTNLQAQALRGLLQRADAAQLKIEERADFSTPELQRLRIALATRPQDLDALLPHLASPDPFVRSDTIHHLATHASLLQDASQRTIDNPQIRVGLLLAWQRSDGEQRTMKLSQWVRDPDPDVRFMALKWIADERLTTFQPWIDQRLADAAVGPREFFALATARARLQGQSADEGDVLSTLVKQLTDPHTKPAVKSLILRGTPAPGERGRTTKAKLALSDVLQLADNSSGELQFEAVRYLVAAADASVSQRLAEMAQDETLPIPVRCHALLGVALDAPRYQTLLLGLAQHDQRVLADEALRALVGSSLEPAQRTVLEQLKQEHPERAELVDRLLRPVSPPTTLAETEDIEPLLRRYQGPGDPAAGQRIFEHPRLARCTSCHIRQGRGSRVGPDLSQLARQSDRRAILQSIVNPNAHVDPHFTTWRVVTDRGTTHTGQLVEQTEQDQTYLDSEGRLFKLKNESVESIDALPLSLMPTGLLAGLTDQEVRDLLAYLQLQPD